MAILNTRLRLKYDTWDNWIRDNFAENFIPLRGEVCVVEVPKTNLEPEITETGAVDSKANNVEKPAILFKVGDGETSFDKLPWASGLAADVYAWAKAETKPSYEANEITVSDGVTVKDFLDALEATQVAYTKKAEVEGGEDTQTTVSAALDSLYEAIKLVSGDSSASIGELVTKVNANTQDIAALKNLVGEEKVSDQINDAIEELNLANTYASKSEFETHVEEVKEYGSRITAVETVAGNAATNAALEEEIARAKAAEEANAANIKTIADDYITSADIAEVSEKVDILIGEETDAGKSVRTIANEELAAQLIAEGAAESLNTLQEIAAWIQAHPGDASAMNSAIQALQAKTVLGTNTEGTEYATVKAYVEAAIAALNIGDYALAANLTALAGRVETLENAGHQNAEEVQTAITTAINDLDSFVEATETTDDGEVSVLTKVVQENGKLTDKSEVKLAKIATNGSIYDVKEVEKDLNGEAEVDCFIFYGGSATELIKNY